MEYPKSCQLYGWNCRLFLFHHGAYKDKVRKMVLNNAIFLSYLNEGFDTFFQMVGIMGC